MLEDWSLYVHVFSFFFCVGMTIWMFREGRAKGFFKLTITRRLKDEEGESSGFFRLTIGEQAKDVDDQRKNVP